VPADWALVRRIARIVAALEWLPGIHRDHPAELAGVTPGCREFRAALGIAWRLRRIDY
jgi:hypothetical protein